MSKPIEVLKVISPESESRCGDCPNIYPGPTDDYCGVFGEPVAFVGNDFGKYRRLSVCVEGQKMAEDLRTREASK